MNNNFDLVVDRKGTGCLKWDLHGELSPYWVADMDFRSPECILSALQKQVDHGIFGYAIEPEGFVETLVAYMKTSHGVEMRPEWIVHMGGCVPALATVAMCFTKSGESVMTCSPVYPPIRSVHNCSGASLIDVPHIYADGHWTFDWEAMEKAVRPDTRLFILCNPQNPLGRVFTREEITKLAEFCEKHNLLLCSDEIHCDLVLDESAAHFSALSLPEAYLQRVIVLTAPSKTYNIAGIGYSMAIIPSDDLRNRFQQMQLLGQPPVHRMAYASAHAAYGQGESWRLELIAYLRANRDELYRFVKEHMPLIKMTPMQATYLAWLDCSELGMENPQQFFIDKAGVYLNSGEPFGALQCVRFNFGTGRDSMLTGLNKMAKAIQDWQAARS